MKETRASGCISQTLRKDIKKAAKDCIINSNLATVFALRYIVFSGILNGITAYFVNKYDKI